MKIICIGRNYRDHAAELKNAVPTEPVIFLKPDSAILRNDGDFYYPEFSRNIHYEAELVVKINKVGKYIEPKFAHTYYNEVSLGIDFTARDLQDKQKEKGLPWEIAKAFDYSACIGKSLQLDSLSKPIDQLSFNLLKNGNVVQQGNTADMLFHINDLIAYISKFFTLKIGDLIYTGTPKGVGPIEIGDTFTGFLDDKKVLSCTIK